MKNLNGMFIALVMSILLIFPTQIQASSLMNSFNGTGLVVVIQGFQNGPGQVEFDQQPKVLLLEATIVSDSGAVVYQTITTNPTLDFSGVTLPAGKNYLILSLGGEVKQIPLSRGRR